MPMYNLIKYSDIYLKLFGGLCQYHINESALSNACDVINFPANNISISFKCKEKITGQKYSNGTKHDEIMVPLKYLNAFTKTIDMLLINREVTLTLLGL